MFVLYIIQIAFVHENDWRKYGNITGANGIIVIAYLGEDSHMSVKKKIPITKNTEIFRKELAEGEKNNLINTRRKMR